MFGSAAGPLVMAHRGGAALGHENSIEVLQAAAEAGADAVEIDVQELGDGSLILAHDSSVKRWWGLWRTRLDTIGRRRYEQVTGRPAVTVGDLIARLEGLHLALYLEIKSVSPAGIRNAIDLIIASGIADRTAIGSFHRDAVRLVAADGRLPASILYRDRDADPVALQRDLQCSIVHPCFDNQPLMVSKLAGAWMDAAHGAGLRVVGWNTNDAELLAQMAAAGFDALCTDDPRIVRSAPWRRDQ